jgi:hypothetical protein
VAKGLGADRSDEVQLFLGTQLGCSAQIEGHGSSTAGGMPGLRLLIAPPA